MRNYIPVYYVLVHCILKYTIYPIALGVFSSTKLRPDALQLTNCVWRTPIDTRVWRHEVHPIASDATKSTALQSRDISLTCNFNNRRSESMPRIDTQCIQNLCSESTLSAFTISTLSAFTIHAENWRDLRSELHSHRVLIINLAWIPIIYWSCYEILNIALFGNPRCALNTALCTLCSAFP